MRDKALAAIARYGMISQNDRVLVALSGGADSVALLHFLHALRGDWGLELGALHLNHKLRGEESERDEAFVRALCRELDLPLAVEAAEIAALARQAGEGVEACGRRLRYAFFAREAEKAGGKVALAHTASDNAETLLINLVRGSALRGLAGIPPVRGVFVRPLIACPREEIEAYCHQNALAWVEDSTNRSDDYTRNRIRRQVLPLLKAESPRFLDKVTDLAQSLREDADYLDALADRETARLARPDHALDRAGFLALPKVLQGRVLAALLRSKSIPPERAAIDGMRRAITLGRGGRQLSPDVVFACGEDAFTLKAPSKSQPYFEVRVDISALASGDIWVEANRGKRIGLQLEGEGSRKKSSKVQKKDLNYCLDYDRIGKVVTLRGRLAGDRLRIPGRGCTKTLKNLFQESGVCGTERQAAIILADRDGPIWVEGFGPDERAAADERTTRTIIIEVLTEEKA